MRRLIVLATVALTAASSAIAADLEPSTVGQGTAAPFSRTGCFVGGHIGASEGFVGGGQIGCDYQFAPQWIAGVGGQAAWATVKKTQAGTLTNSVTGVTIPSQDTLRIDFLASATVRLGFGVNRWLFYVKGGAAWINQKMDVVFTNTSGTRVDASATVDPTGWTIGTGFDWTFAPHWSSTLEYNYYDLSGGSVLLTDPATTTTVRLLGTRDQIQTLTGGVNYHF